MRLGRVNHRARLTALRGMSQHELGKHAEAASSFEESLELCIADSDRRQTVAVSAGLADKPPEPGESAEIALRAAHCIQETGDPKLAHKKVDLLNKALQLLSEESPGEVRLEAGLLTCDLIATLSPGKRKPMALTALNTFQRIAASSAEDTSKDWKEISGRLDLLTKD